VAAGRDGTGAPVAWNDSNEQAGVLQQHLLGLGACFGHSIQYKRLACPSVRLVLSSNVLANTTSYFAQERRRQCHTSSAASL